MSDMLELKNLTDGFEGYDGPILVPADKVASYEKVHLTIFLGENFVGPMYTHRRALEVNLTHGASVYAADCAVNRILLDINKLD